MLVILSDLHLTDRSVSGITISSRAFNILKYRLSDMAYDASHRSDGSYRPLEEMHVLMLGDILDVIRSDGWETVKPWDDSSSPDFVRTVGTITDRILAANSESMAILKQITQGNAVTIPPATAAGKVADVGHDLAAEGRVPVRIHLHYMVGNHDWFYHLPGAAHNAVRQKIVDAMGLANNPNEAFPHNPDASSVLSQIYRDHSVLARHGDIFDGMNYEGDRNASSLGDAVVVELLNKFYLQVRRDFEGRLPAATLNGLRELDNVRPLILAPTWIEDVLVHTCTDTILQAQVKDTWNAIADDFLKLDFVRARDSVWNPFDNVDKLQLVLKIGDHFSIRTISSVAAWFYDKFGSGKESYREHAMTEEAFRSGRANYIVYGHTHHHETVALRRSGNHSTVQRQLYFNTGTWRQVHERTADHDDATAFLGWKVMTYLAFYRGDERGGRPFELWSGALADDPAS